jgi:glycosyltransferase involved in cell wall biosynthesis
MISSKKQTKICLTPELNGVGGMVSFQRKLLAGLGKRGIETSFSLAEDGCSSVLVVGGSRKLGSLKKLGRRGMPIVQRLDGINWIHRQSRTGMRHWLRAEYGNWLLSTIRNRYASELVYQSEFVRDWWQKKYGTLSIPNRVIYNGVELDHFSPAGNEKPAKDLIRILLVEASLMGGYEFGLGSAVGLAEALAEKHKRPVELVVAGRVSGKLQQYWSTHSSVAVQWAGLISQEELPALYRSAHLLYSADLNAACPNAVIEAMACGVPIVAFDTGALNELINDEAGKLADYGADPWALEAPNIGALAEAAEIVLKSQRRYRVGARARAEEAFGLDKMISSYIEVLSPQNG